MHQPVESFKRLPPAQQILLRPDTYIGSTQATQTQTWIWNKNKGAMEFRFVTYVPGLYQLIAEVLINAVDECKRLMDAGGSDTNLEIRVDVDATKHIITVCNSGGPPVAWHPEYDLWVPEMLFGDLLTSINFNDDQPNYTGGRNGYGAKLANIFSRWFSVEVVDAAQCKRFTMEWMENMQRPSEPVIEEVGGEGLKSSTKVSFQPDLARFGVKSFDSELIALMNRRVRDIAGCNETIDVYFNGELLTVKSFEQYVGLYCGPKCPHVFAPPVKGWRVCVCATRDDDADGAPGRGDQAKQDVSSVNSLSTMEGTHVDHVKSILVASLLQKMSTSIMGGAKPWMIRRHLWVFIKATLPNPQFDAQTKTKLISPITESMAFSCTPDFISKAMKQLYLADKVCYEVENLKQQEENKRRLLSGQLREIDKLVDAPLAGVPDRKPCTLILIEGDSAMTLVMAGLEVLGRDTHGVFPLRGKILNPLRNKRKKKQSTKLTKMSRNIQEILGLPAPTDGTIETKTLRYDKVMIMADQDADGSHIKGLIINMLCAHWPSLLQKDGFITMLVTPVLKLFDREGRRKPIWCFSTAEYELEYRSLSDGYVIKYYKGLGSSTRQEAIEYLRRAQELTVEFQWSGEQDHNALIQAFSEENEYSELRKRWISDFRPDTFLDCPRIKTISYSDFVQIELVSFFVANCERSIACMIDGLKPVNRKILHCCIQNKLDGGEEIKVAQLAGMVSYQTAYHHGEKSLTDTITSMAQNFVGKNNINLLQPGGGFGSRRQGGADAAKPRYICTRLEPITRAIFHPHDDDILKYREEDGMKVEPRFYLPVIPMILVNGTTGIGSGFSTYVPPYHPREIIDNLKRMLLGEKPQPMYPYFNGFTGHTTLVGNKLQFTGSFHLDDEKDPSVLFITELPVGIWTENYKAKLISLQKKEGLIEGFSESHTDTTIHFTVYLTDKGKNIPKDEVASKFDLIKNVDLNNMWLYDAKGSLRFFPSVLELLEDYFYKRLRQYRRRKEHRTRTLEEELSRLNNRLRLVREVRAGEIFLHVPRAELIRLLDHRQYAHHPSPPDGKSSNKFPRDTNAIDWTEVAAAGFEYLLSMPILSLTEEETERLEDQKRQKERELEELKTTSVERLWLKDLEALERILDKMDFPLAPEWSSSPFEEEQQQQQPDAPATSDRRVQHCRRCREHGKEVLRKGHLCPYAAAKEEKKPKRKKGESPESTAGPAEPTKAKKDTKRKPRQSAEKPDAEYPHHDKDKKAKQKGQKRKRSESTATQSSKRAKATKKDTKCKSEQSTENPTAQVVEHATQHPAKEKTKEKGQKRKRSESTAAQGKLPKAVNGTQPKRSKKD